MPEIKPQIKHVFVLMLENRSFDHLLGFAGIPGTRGVPAGASVPKAPGDPSPIAVTATAANQLQADVPHEYDDVQRQLTGPYAPGQTTPGHTVTMQGFVQSGHADSVACFAAEKLPVLTTLAKSYAVCDSWFASMPGPTWPNRFFVHAASSGGLDNSPSDFVSAVSSLSGLLKFKFESGTIFDRLDQCGLPWRVYHGDHFPQVLSIDGMVASYVRDPKRWKLFDADSFKADLSNNFEPAYVFIEPDYDSINGMKDGNSQHPTSQVAKGEQLIQDVFEAISSSPIWNNSVLLVTYDEHGGFYDHVAPPACMPPGDAALNHTKAKYPKDCKFDSLGVRVPAVVISPWIKAGTVIKDPDPAARAYDHSSVFRTLRSLFPALGGNLTARDAHAPEFAYLFSDGYALGEARQDLPVFPTAGGPVGSAKAALLAKPPAAQVKPTDASLDGFLFIAKEVDEEISRADPVAHPLSLMAIHGTRPLGDPRQYLKDVETKIRAHRAAHGRAL